MVKLAGQERQGWRARVGRSDWVDESSWVDAPDSAEEGAVEFLEAEPSAYRLSKVDFERQSTANRPVTRTALIVGLGVVLIAFAIMSQPDGDRIEDLPTADQLAIQERQAEREDPAQSDEEEGAGSPRGEGEDEEAAADGGESGTETEGDARSSATLTGDQLESPLPRQLAEIPPLRADLPELPGVIYGFGLDASVVRIASGLETPEETPLDLSALGRSGSASGLAFADGYTVIDQGVVHRVGEGGGAVEVEPSGNRIAPTDDGGLTIVTTSNDTQSAYVVAADESVIRPIDDRLYWNLGRDVEILGGWRDRLLITKAGAVWLIDREGRTETITSGRVLGFDGTHLTVLACPAPDTCRIEVGPPDQPSRRAVAVPEQLSTLAVDSWAGAVAVSRDGEHLALRSWRAAVSIPVVIGLATGETIEYPDAMNASSTIVFSPDGKWMAYAFSDDVMVMNLEQRRSWRIMTERRIDQLAWLEGGTR